MRNLLRMLACLMVVAFAAAADANLLTNPELAIADGKLAGWKTPNGVGAADAAGLPDGVAGSIKLTSDGADKSSSGQIAQRLAVGDHGTHWRAAAWAKASAKGVAYIQVKLIAPDKKELKRITIGEVGTEWKRAVQDIDATGASEIELLLRWSRAERHAGANVWFAAALLAPAPADAAPAPAAGK